MINMRNEKIQNHPSLPLCEKVARVGKDGGEKLQVEVFKIGNSNLSQEDVDRACDFFREIQNLCAAGNGDVLEITSGFLRHHIQGLLVEVMKRCNYIQYTMEQMLSAPRENVIALLETSHNLLGEAEDIAMEMLLDDISRQSQDFENLVEKVPTKDNSQEVDTLLTTLERLLHIK